MTKKFTFINVFEIPEGKEEIFHQDWHIIIEQLKNAEGLLSVRLYEVDSEVEEHLLSVPGISTRLRTRPSAKAKFHFIVVAEWESTAHYEAVANSTGEEGRQLLPFSSHPAYYRVVSEYTQNSESI